VSVTGDRLLRNIYVRILLTRYRFQQSVVFMAQLAHSVEDLSAESMRISVCMAAYNGARYIQEQIASILPQLGFSDELIIVDDASQDDTVRAILSFGDKRITLLHNEQNRGVIKSFERALMYASGDLIFLSDQDDVWRPDKIETFRKFFAANPAITLALSDARVVDEGGREISASWMEERGGFRSGVTSNFVKNRYLGCAMAFRKIVLKNCLPFPPGAPMHDMWIGLTNELSGRAGFVNEALFNYRRHGTNATTGRHAAIGRMIRWRWNLAASLFARIIAIKEEAKRGLPAE
jgi:glycosyltransferase involved in cell wall biosynthesis